MWIVPELLLASQLQLLCGNRTFQWDDLLAFWLDLIEYY